MNESKQQRPISRQLKLMTNTGTKKKFLKNGAHAIVRM